MKKRQLTQITNNDDNQYVLLHNHCWDKWINIPRNAETFNWEDFTIVKTSFIVTGQNCNECGEEL